MSGTERENGRAEVSVGRGGKKAWSNYFLDTMRTI